MKFITKTEQETRKLGEKLVNSFMESEKNRTHAIVISLEGDLGTGKTTFTQGLAKSVGVSDWIKSPTFVLMREHVVGNNLKAKIQKLVHIDCYRINKPEGLIDIGLKDFLKNKENIVLIEWGKKLIDYLPKDTIKIQFKHLDNNSREIIVN